MRRLLRLPEVSRHINIHHPDHTKEGGRRKNQRQHDCTNRKKQTITQARRAQPSATQRHRTPPTTKSRPSYHACQLWDLVPSVQQGDWQPQGERIAVANFYFFSPNLPK
jgi:hypothetical protein